MIDNKTNEPNIAAEMAQAEVAQMEEIVAMITAQLVEEKSQTKPEREQLEKMMVEAIKKVQAIEMELNHNKSAAKGHKKEIDEWKRWYYGLSDIDKSADMEKLNAEINWRSGEISQLEAKIKKLNEQYFLAQSQVEQIKQQLHVLDSGHWDVPIEADPRLLAAKRALNEALAQLREFEIHA